MISGMCVAGGEGMLRGTQSFNVKLVLQSRYSCLSSFSFKWPLNFLQAEVCTCIPSEEITLPVPINGGTAEQQKRKVLFENDVQFE
jgi:hypothetical protein